MALKIIFKFQRNYYNHETKRENDQQIKQNLNRILIDKGITTSHFYPPGWNSIKVIFPTDSEIDKVMENEESFKAENFEPKMSLSLKSCRTVFCTNFDPVLLQTYDKKYIKEILKEQKWKVKEIYIMKSNKSFKVELTSRSEAKKFLKHENINIGGIRIGENCKEPELDPTIIQCWECGEMDPNHKSQNCTGHKKCIKCGETSHNFFNCPIPKELNEMSEQQKGARYCTTCKTKGTHTSLDHRLCPKKRNILRERAVVERGKRLTSNETNSRDIELIRKAIDLSNNEQWPMIQTTNQTPQNSKITTIVTLALLDEASNPGTFDKKLEEAFNNNGLPIIKYKLEANTAKNFQKTLCGAHSTDPNTSKYYKDQTRQKRSANQDEPSEEESIDINSRKEKKIRIIKVNKAIQKGATALPTQQRKIEYDRVKISTTAEVEEIPPEEIYLNLKKELDKKCIILQTENAEEQPVIRSCTLKQILEILENNEILNENEWKLLIRSYILKLIKHHYVEIRIKVKILKMTKETDKTTDISIIRSEAEDNLDEENIESEYEGFEDSSDSQDTLEDQQYAESLTYALETAMHKEPSKTYFLAEEIDLKKANNKNPTI